MWDPPPMPEVEAPPEPIMTVGERKLAEKQAMRKLISDREKRIAARFPNRKPSMFKQPPAPIMRSARIPRAHKARLPRDFQAKHVNTMRNMIERHMDGEEHRFICISDKSDGLDPRVDWLKTPDAARELSELKSPEGERFPSCYRRLWVWSKEAKILGDRILCLDIDLVVVNSLRKVWAMEHPVVGWRPYRDWGKKRRIGGGQYMLTPGAATFVWDDFKGLPSIAEARAAGFRGSDQAWLSYKLPEVPVWGQDAGLYSVRDIGATLDLPADATLVQFNGQAKPWHHVDGRVRPVQWVLDHWR